MVHVVRYQVVVVILAIAGSAVDRTVESRFSMNSAQATISGSRMRWGISVWGGAAAAAGRMRRVSLPSAAAFASP